MGIDLTINLLQIFVKCSINYHVYNKQYLNKVRLYPVLEY